MNIIRATDVDVLIIGGGILGVGIAAVVAQRGFRVLLLRLPDINRPHADTLRNQAWLQSGLMYIDRFEDRKHGLLLAKRMFHGGNAMLAQLGVQPPSDDRRGILRVKGVDDTNQLLADAKDLSISKLVNRIPHSEAESRLGSLYDSQGQYFTIPDAPFDEAMVMTRLREAAQQNGATLAETAEPITLKLDSSKKALQVDLGGQPVKSKVTVCAAGAGNISLRDQLGLQPIFTIRQTPLLVADEDLGTNAFLFADRSRGWSFTRHPSAPGGSANAYVIGTRVHRPVDFKPADARRILADDFKLFRQCLPDSLAHLCDRGRFTAGYEIIPDESTRTRYVEPWVDQHPEFPQLLFAMPGRATLGLFTARQVATSVFKHLSDDGHRGKGRSSLGLSNDQAWNGQVHMHFEPYFDFNDYFDD
jgi:glycine/D-amino acid oxidase-like deaminating enzyme